MGHPEEDMQIHAAPSMKQKLTSHRKWGPNLDIYNGMPRVEVRSAQHPYLIITRRVGLASISWMRRD